MVQDIKAKYLKIINKNVDKLDSIFIDASYKPSKEEMEEAPSGHMDTYLIYFVGTDTLLIRNITLSDEGGAFGTKLTEVAFWDKRPIFFYEKSYVSSDKILNEERIYVYEDKVIRKLQKSASISSMQVLNLGIDKVFANEIPNTQVEINPRDYRSIKYFIETARSKIEGR